MAQSTDGGGSMDKDILYNTLMGFINALQTAELFDRQDQENNKERAAQAREYAHSYAYGGEIK